MEETVTCEVQEEAVKAALVCDKGAKAQLLSWQSKFFSQLDGYTSTILNIRVKYRHGGQDSEVFYVVKVSPSRQEQENDFYHQIYAKEIQFYGEILPSLNSELESIGQAPLSFPKCFYYSLEKGKEILFLENLKEQGYEMKNKAIGVDITHTFLVLKELAKLHAASIILQSKSSQDPTEKFTMLGWEWTREFNLGCDFGNFVDHHLEIAVQMFKKMGDCDQVVEWVEKIRPHAWKMYEELLVKTPPFVGINHGDCWINNLLFRYDDKGNPVEVKLLDLQGHRYASVSLDLHHFINLNVEPELRQPNLTSFLKTYHDTFIQVLEAGQVAIPFSLDELEKEYRDNGFYGVLYSMMWLPVMLRRKEDHIEILNSAAGRRQAELESVLAMVDNNPLLRPRIISVIKEWQEYGLIS